MDYIILFLVDGLMGYVLQSIGNILAIYAFNKRLIDTKWFLITTVIFSTVMFLIRNINVINFGFHTILIMIAFILISVLMLKTQVYSTVLAILATSITIMVSEFINYGILALIIGKAGIDALLKGSDSLQVNMNRAITGIPTNIILVVVMFIVYRVLTKKIKGDKANGSSGKKSV